MHSATIPWGKFRDSESWLPLTDHMSDVADCFVALLDLPLFRARLTSTLGREPDDVTLARLAALAYLHDLGKLSSSFQAKATNPAMRAGHSVQGWQVFAMEDKSVFRALGLPELAGWGDATQGLLLGALAHHGRPVNGAEFARLADWKPRDGYDPLEGARIVGAACRKRFPRAFEPGTDLPDNPELQHFFAGLVALSDQIGSHEDYFPLKRRGAAPARTDDVLRRLRVDVRELRGAFVEQPASRLFGWTDGTAPNAMQQALADLPLDIRLAVLESETGSGKTEAAFLRFMRLFEAKLVDGLYFAVPTRAAASQIHARIDHAARTLFGEECVLALPGYLKAGDAEGRALPGWRVEWSDDPGAARREARWSAETPRRFLAAPVAVGTVDQVMLSGLQVKWAHFRAATLSRSLLVVDEVHSSDSYMGAVIGRVVRDHVARGGHALLMSATLGAATRAQLLGRPRKPERHENYPAISHVEARKEVHISPRRQDRTKAVDISKAPIIADPESVARLALEASARGGRVLVIRNTVDQVVATHRAIEALAFDAPLLRTNGISSPHHSRYASEDRRLLDGAVEEAMGKRARPVPRIVVGSQTLEQSLDIDADYLITDICPIDVLLQRIGRLHRHANREDRPSAFHTARCTVLTPETLAPDRHLLRYGLGPGADGNGIYPDIAGLEAVRREVSVGATWYIPEDNRRLVEQGTDPDFLDNLAKSLGADWIKARGMMIGSRIAGGQFAQLNLIQRNRAFDGTREDTFPTDKAILTRMGADRIQVPFAPGTRGPFGTEITEISVPGRWHVECLNEATGAEWKQAAAGTLIFSEARLGYDRFGLTRPSDD